MSEFLKYAASKSRRRHQHWTIYQELCQLIIRSVQTCMSPVVFDTKHVQARSHNEANEAVASPKISKKNLPQMKNS